MPLYTVNIVTALCLVSVGGVRETKQNKKKKIPESHTGQVQLPQVIQFRHGSGLRRLPPFITHSFHAAARGGVTQDHLGVPVGHGRLARRGCCRVRALIRTLVGRDVFGPVELTQTVVQLIQLGRQRDPQLLVEGQSFEPVFQLLKRRTGGGGRGTQGG